MPWVTFLAWQKLAFERRLERSNNKRREEAGLAPVKRPRLDNSRGPQEPPLGEEDHGS